VLEALITGHKKTALIILVATVFLVPVIVLFVALIILEHIIKRHEAEKKAISFSSCL